MNSAVPNTREAGLLVRPIPSTMATGSEPIRFGGRPRLPEGMEWPCSDHDNASQFFAEIDLARLPRGDGLPAIPDRGTLFLFLPLANDGLYGYSNADVLYTENDVTSLPERDPPEGLPNIHQSDPCHVHEDGTTDDGRILIRQVAEVLPFLSSQAVNPLAINMSEGDNFDGDPWRAAHAKQQAAIEEAFRAARALPSDPAFDSTPAGFEQITPKIAKRIREFSWKFEGHHLDWEFIWDWSKEFYRLCQSLLLKHLKEMRDVGVQTNRVDRMIRRMQAKRKEHNRQIFGEGKKPFFFKFSDPVSVKETFDWQAKRWMQLARFQSGYPPAAMIDAFCEMLSEVARHYEETDDAGYNLGPRIGLIDHKIKGHDKHAGNTLVAAKNAFKVAVERALARHETAFERLDQATRWDSRVIQAGTPRYERGFSLGIMPLQMFGLGFEIQSSVSDHAKDILLFQIGDSFGLPLDRIGPDCIIQLWVSPEDLAAGRFDRVEMTMDMT